MRSLLNLTVWLSHDECGAAARVGFIRRTAIHPPMPGDGPFLFLREGSPPAGFWHLPPGGMCVSSFLFVRRGSKVLLGKYKDDPAWADLAGLDPERVRRNSVGWTIPASHLKFGEDPRDAARRVGEEILKIPGLGYSEPGIVTETYRPPWANGATHYDLCFLFDAEAPAEYRPAPPPWYAELAWQDPAALPASAYARSHEDIVARWRARSADRR